jgi:hypothetical protein
MMDEPRSIVRIYTTGYGYATCWLTERETEALISRFHGNSQGGDTIVLPAYDDLRTLHHIRVSAITRIKVSAEPAPGGHTAPEV